MHYTFSMEGTFSHISDDSELNWSCCWSFSAKNIKAFYEEKISKSNYAQGPLEIAIMYIVQICFEKCILCYYDNGKLFGY